MLPCEGNVQTNRADIECAQERAAKKDGQSAKAGLVRETPAEQQQHQQQGQSDADSNRQTNRQTDVDPKVEVQI